MNSLQVHGQNLYDGVHLNDTDQIGAREGPAAGEIWVHQRDQGEDLMNVNDPIFYTDFPGLPDFLCMSSSSSSSSSTPAPVQATTPSSSSSSAASWAVIMSEAEEEAPGQPLSTASTDHPPQSQLSDHQEDQVVQGVDCMDVMEGFGCMDLLETEVFFDMSSIFEELDDVNGMFTQQEIVRDHHQDSSILPDNGCENGGVNVPASDDLGVVFLDWLKNNKETVSAEDLRKVKIKKSTIESAASRLGGGKEAMKQLLKLILEWVQTNHLQKRKLMNLTQYQPNPEVLQNPSIGNQGSALPSNPSLNWIGQSQQYAAPETGLVPGYLPIGGFVANPYGHPSGYLPNPVEHNMLGLGLDPNYGSYQENNLPLPPLNPSFTGYGGQYPSHQPYLQGQDSGGVLAGGGCDSGLVMSGSAATKEARKKRMARQRRVLLHHRGHYGNHPNHQHPNQGLDPHARLGSDCCNGAPNSGQAEPRNWVYWPSAAKGNSTLPLLPGDVPMDRTRLQGKNIQRQQQESDRKHGLKSEKNLKFLLQKVLKQSDVGNLGRIVLPKKEAETHLPELEARDGISIVMEDIGTSRVWNMRYRFWPNNKSRMYLLENTGDFVRTNELQEGDFIVIYSDMKCGKYMIRGVKVRQQGPKVLETRTTKRSTKSQRNDHGNSPGATNNARGSVSSAMI